MGHHGTVAGRHRTHWLQSGEPVEQGPKREPGLQPSEVGAETVVEAPPEGQMRIGIAGEVDGLRSLEHPMVVVGGAHGQGHGLSGLNRAATTAVVHGGSTGRTEVVGRSPYRCLALQIDHDSPRPGS